MNKFAGTTSAVVELQEEEVWLWYTELTPEHEYMLSFINTTLDHMTYMFERSQCVSQEEFEQSDYFKTAKSHFPTDAKWKKKKSVSKIVSAIFPFNESDKLRWYKTMDKKTTAKKIAEGQIYAESLIHKQGYATPQVLNALLLNLGTYIHFLARTHGHLDYTPNIPVIYDYAKSVRECFEKVQPEVIMFEKYIETDEYCGTFDSLWRVNGKNILVDYKTFDAYKYMYGYVTEMYTNGKPNVKKDTLIKTGLQLSLYAKGLEQQHPDLKVDALWVVWFTPFGYHIFPVDRDLSLYYKAITDGKL